MGESREAARWMTERMEEIEGRVEYYGGTLSGG